MRGTRMKRCRLLTYFLASTITAFFSSQAFAGFQAPAEDQANLFSVGIEGFHDHYFEPSPDVTVGTDYGSVIASWSHAANFVQDARFLFGMDGRYSYGTASYRSPSGILDGAAQDEFEGRVLMGIEYPHFVSGTLSPYIGLGLRYFVDNGKGELTNLGKTAYDRRIEQLYFPLGATYDYKFGDGWSISPNVEYDQLIRGNVNSRLQNDGGYNVNNTQSHNGYGFRGELLVGKQLKKVTVQAGPFIRYWNVRDSNLVHTPNLPPGWGWEEPSNTRVQYGFELKASW